MYDGEENHYAVIIKVGKTIDLSALCCRVQGVSKRAMYQKAEGKDEERDLYYRGKSTSHDLLAQRAEHMGGNRSRNRTLHSPAWLLLGQATSAFKNNRSDTRRRSRLLMATTTPFSYKTRAVPRKSLKSPWLPSNGDKRARRRGKACASSTLKKFVSGLLDSHLASYAI